MKNLLASLPTRFVNGVSTLGPIGYWGKAPGTNGSFVGLLWYTLFFYQATASTYILLLALSTLIAILFCGESELRMKRKDPPEALIDEVIAMPYCFIGLAKHMQPLWLYMIAGFALFRFFDILKPLGIRKLQNLPGGYGIVIDDLAAAFATCLCLHLLRLFVF
ncbi:MAG: hypothetical protein A2Y14_05075 [Verrucomicrobia bacterium GWF2_51_19]|nr:MAG: hypothetical protein A2Y14_05075 [Verrucomicrobia bacterium GWF2_51_19]HCJ11737.1 phosphatidylglycerophosphatase A [Opitutae bacterium]